MLSTSSYLLIHRVAKQPENRDLQDALLGLGRVNDFAGKLGVLRVLITYPVTCDMGAIKRVAEEDKFGHPCATLDMAKLAKMVGKDKVLGSLKRKAHHNKSDGEPHNPKRPKGNGG